MRLLLDSHVLLWWLDGAERLSGEAVTAIGSSDNDVLVSAASLWELMIKQSIGKLKVEGDLRQHAKEQWFHELPVTGRHAAEVAFLPWHHGDPFDRMLVAQARCEGLTLVTVDHAVQEYDVSVLPA
jgi:PIN domain nuclease of toxin-antitoxin system